MHMNVKMCVQVVHVVGSGTQLHMTYIMNTRYGGVEVQCI